MGTMGMVQALSWFEVAGCQRCLLKGKLERVVFWGHNILLGIGSSKCLKI